MMKAPRIVDKCGYQNATGEVNKNMEEVHLLHEDSGAAKHATEFDDKEEDSGNYCPVHLTVSISLFGG